MVPNVNGWLQGQPAEAGVGRGLGVGTEFCKAVAAT